MLVRLQKSIRLFCNYTNVSYFSWFKKKNTFILGYQKELYPATLRIWRIKHFLETRWTYHDKSIDAIYLTYGAILRTLQKIIDQKCNEMDVKFKTLA